MLTKAASAGGFGASVVFLCGAVWHAAPTSPEQNLGKVQNDVLSAVVAASAGYAAFKAGHNAEAIAEVKAKPPAPPPPPPSELSVF